MVWDKYSQKLVPQFEQKTNQNDSEEEKEDDETYSQEAYDQDLYDLKKQFKARKKLIKVRN